MITRFSARAWSTALIDFSRDTDSGTMMNGKITRSFSGRTGRTSGILIASSLAVSFASVMSQYLGENLGVLVQWLFLLISGDATLSQTHPHLRIGDTRKRIGRRRRGRVRGGDP